MMSTNTSENPPGMGKKLEANRNAALIAHNTPSNATLLELSICVRSANATMTHRPTTSAVTSGASCACAAASEPCATGDQNGHRNATSPTRLATATGKPRIKRDAISSARPCARLNRQPRAQAEHDNAKDRVRDYGR